MGVTRLDLRTTTGFVSGGVSYVFLVRDDGPSVIIASTCPHRGGPVNLGACDGDAVICPWHQTRLRLPAMASRRVPFVFVRDGAIVTLVGPPVQELVRLPVLDAHRVPVGAGV